jgi:ATP-dependent Lon protease
MLGDVMRESAQAAHTLVRSHAKEWKIKPADLADFDLHVHVPAGATPKDGPSAGVSMLTSMVSIITNRVVDPTTAMTGEITLRGAVLPVGGIKEKFLAAHRAGIKRIIMPERNLTDLDDIPQEVRDELTFVPVRTIEQVIRAAFNPPAKRTESKSSAAATVAPEKAIKRVPKKPKSKRPKPSTRKKPSAARTRRKPAAKRASRARKPRRT